jgi:membrane-bound inhibitor of C-type lysozyme
MTRPLFLLLSGWLSLAIAAEASSGAALTLAQNPAATITYQCAANQTLAVTVIPASPGKGEEVQLTLPDKSALTLPRVVSASGAKYSNGTFTFWSKGNTAFVEQGETVVLKDCVTIPE